MSINLEKLLDPTAKRILRALQDNARLPFSEIGRQVGLSTPAVSERVRRLEDAGVITGYRAELDAGKLGYPLTAFIRLYTPPERYPRLYALVAVTPEVLECYHVTGDESFIMKIVASSIGHLEGLIAKFSPFGGTSTSIVLSVALERRALPEGTQVQPGATG